MYIYMCVYLYIYMYVYICVYIRVYTHFYTWKPANNETARDHITPLSSLPLLQVGSVYYKYLKLNYTPLGLSKLSAKDSIPLYQG